jgi:hypothetical protein
MLDATQGHGRLGPQFHPLGSCALLAALVTLAPAVWSAEFQTGQGDLKVRWDNTVKYSGAWRTKHQSAALLADANQDDGDRNFRRGLVSNRVDLLSELDVTTANTGFRLSGAAWYDSVYNRRNDNDSPGTFNPYSVPHDEFTSVTRTLHGRKAELLDAFVFAKTELGEMPATLRLGRHTLLYGESLFYGNNGIAAAQSPTDLVKLLSVPGTQFKELIRPVSQVSGQIQLKPNLALGAYYQFRWERDRLPAAGSYFSSADLLDGGGERILAGPGAAFLRTRDLEARNSGQGGMQLRYRPEDADVELGFYAVNFHSKSPVVYAYLSPAFAPSTFRMAFPENIKAYGASFSTTVGETNVAGELSYRRNMPLVAQGGAVTVLPGVVADNRDHPLYPVGQSLHAQVSWISLLSRSALWEGGSFVGELAWNRRLGIRENAQALDPNASCDAAAVRFIFQPTYYQVIGGLDLSVPIGLGYGLYGKSSVLNPGFSVNHGGDFSIGIAGDYLKVWKFSLDYRYFFGTESTATGPTNAQVQSWSYNQSLHDRNFLALSVQRSF